MKKNPMKTTENRPMAMLVTNEAAEPSIDENAATLNIF